MLAVAKPGDECWTLVDDQRGWIPHTISFKGHFYCLTDQGVMVVETSVNQPPHLVLAAELPKRSPLLLSTMYLVDNGGELILVNCTKLSTRTKCRNSSIITKKYFIKYKGISGRLEGQEHKTCPWTWRACYIYRLEGCNFSVHFGVSFH
jgi:hypothetical protein